METNLHLHSLEKYGKKKPKIENIELKIAKSKQTIPVLYPRHHLDTRAFDDLYSTQSGQNPATPLFPSLLPAYRAKLILPHPYWMSNSQKPVDNVSNRMETFSNPSYKAPLL